jgi:ATP-dependent RNA helicase RhlE
MKLPIRVEIARSGSVAKDVTQEIFFIPQEEKSRLLEKTLQDYSGSVLVFTRTKFGAKRIAAMVRGLGHTAVEIHSNRSLNQRKEALAGFKTGKYRVLVATDVAARGIDVHNIELVVNYDLPEQLEDYVHRIGRTGRAGGAGHAISFARLDQKHDVIVIERIIRMKLPVSRLPDLPPRHELHVRGNAGGERRFSHSRGSNSRGRVSHEAGSRKPYTRKPSSFPGDKPHRGHSGPKKSFSFGHGQKKQGSRFHK